jgi:hypothetical protein
MVTQDRSQSAVSQPPVGRNQFAGAMQRVPPEGKGAAIMARDLLVSGSKLKRADA